MNTNKPSAPHCPRCGAALAADAAEGLCPRCLLALNLGPPTQLTGEDATGRQPATPPSIAELAPLFPQLEILELLGQGGMGAVYRARQKQLDRIVALKILPPGVGGDTAFAARFATEARALAKLNHPNIVTIYDFGVTGRGDTPVAPTSSGDKSVAVPGVFYFIMEFVDGMNLRQLMAAGRLAPREALAIVPQICDALQYAHDAGIVHRDIKPENILLDRRGRVKVADFGLAKLVGVSPAPDPSDPSHPSDLRASSQVTTTAAGVVMGTPQYMAPEQREHPMDVDHRADIYSLGVVFYQMLTGELPKGAFAPPSKKVVLDVRLDEVVLRALEKNPELRYQHVSDVKTLVETIATTPAGARGKLPRKTGLTRLLEILFDTTFTSPVAIKLANLSALGFLGSLGFLQALPLPGWERCAGFFGLYGLFGFIGVAFIVEMFARAKAVHVPTPGGDRAASGAAGRLAYVVFALLYLVLTIGLLLTASWLPERVATHFGLEGRPNGWMSRAHFLAFAAALPLLLALVFAGLSTLIKVLPARFCNLPNRDFWLAPERRATTVMHIRHWLAGLLSLMTLFFAGLHVLTFIANRCTPQQLPMGGLLLLVIVFLLALMIWLTMFLMRFAEIRTAGNGEPPPSNASRTAAHPSAATQSLGCRIRQHFVVVGRRDGRAVIHWPGVRLGFALVIGVMVLVSWLCVGRSDARVMGLGFLVALAIMAGKIIGEFMGPVEKLRPLDEPVATALRPDTPPQLPGAGKGGTNGFADMGPTARAKRFGKLALMLCLGGLVLPVLLLAMRLPPQTRLGALLWLGAFGITSLCEIAAIVLGLIGWKSGAGKAAVVVAAVLPFVAVPGSLIAFRMVSQVSQERWLAEEERSRAYLEQVETVLRNETTQRLGTYSVRCDHLKVIASPAGDLATLVLANPQELRGVGGSNAWTAINGLLTARPKGDGCWEVRGDQQLGHINFTVQVPVPAAVFQHEGRPLPKGAYRVATTALTNQHDVVVRRYQIETGSLRHLCLRHPGGVDSSSLAPDMMTNEYTGKAEALVTISVQSTPAHAPTAVLAMTVTTHGVVARFRQELALPAVVDLRTLLTEAKLPGDAVLTNQTTLVRAASDGKYLELNIE